MSILDLLALSTAGTERFSWTDETVSRYDWPTLLRASRQGFLRHS